MAYNGWTNWATWNVELWLDNEEPLYRAKCAFIRRTDRDDIDNLSVERFVLDYFPNGTPDMDSAKELADVNWQEIAESWQAEKDEDDRLSA
jgi:hypothetical protein